MRKRPGVGLAFVLSLACLAGDASAQAAKTDAALSRISKEFAAAFNAKDVAKAAGHYTEDAVVYPPNEAAVRGRAGIQAWLKREFELGVTNLVLTPVESSISGTFGYETGTYSISVKPATGAAMTDKGKYLVVFKQVGGKWLNAHDMFNSDLPPPPSPPAPAKSPGK